MYVIIDPGVTTGWSLWGSSGLVDCGLGDPRSSPKHSASDVSDVWIEHPIVYALKNAADIVKLAIDAGRWAGRYDMLGVEAHFVFPVTWKGQVPKDICHARTYAVLRDAEREVVDRAGRGVPKHKLHNMLDAVAMGVWVTRTQVQRWPSLRVVK